MNEENDFALVPKPPTALERIQPGARRVLSGMVADTLALVKKDSPQKSTFTVLLGLDHFAGMMDLVLASRLGETHNLRFLYFARSSELLKLAELHSFDLVFMYIGNVVWDISSDDGSWQGAASILGELKTRYGKPIVATQGMDLSAELEPEGIIFLNAPYTLDNFWDRLQPHLTAPVSQWISKRTFSVAISGFNPGCELEQLFFIRPLQEILGNEYVVTLHYFSYARQWEVTGGGYSLHVIFLNPVLWSSRNNDEVEVAELVTELKAKSQSPLIILTNGGKYGLESATAFTHAGADAFFSFLPPFPTDSFKQTLKRCVAEWRTQGFPTAQPSKSRPRRIVVVDDENFCLEMFRLLIQDWFEEVTLLEFSNSGDAWRELSQTDPDLLILDMPLSGVEILPLLAERKVKYPILATSGLLGEKEMRQQANPNLSVSCLAKPFSPEQFNRELLTRVGPSDNPQRKVWSNKP